ncbi:MAG TPA: hypothetical protein VLX12_01025 [Syntrophorhabdales bacterium]|nr:hypothetical protein [Syntrophorhabdales bacterium]
MNTSLALQANFQITQKELILHYKVTNPTSRDAYLLNRLYRYAPKWEMTPNVIYVRFDLRARTVWLYKKLADLPRGVRVSEPVAPFVTPLRGGSTFQEDVHIALPVKEWEEYAVGPERDKDLKANVFNQVYFTLGYYWRPEGTIEETTNVEGTNIVLPRTPPGATLEFGLLQSDVVKMDIPVLTFDSAHK